MSVFSFTAPSRPTLPLPSKIPEVMMIAVVVVRERRCARCGGGIVGGPQSRIHGFRFWSFLRQDLAKKGAI